jgi:hypothetical protein
MQMSIDKGCNISNPTMRTGLDLSKDHLVLIQCSGLQISAGHRTLSGQMNTSAKGCWESLLKFINLLTIPSSLSPSYSTFPLCSWATLIEIAVYNAERASVMWAEVKQGLSKRSET